MRDHNNSFIKYIITYVILISTSLLFLLSNIGIYVIMTITIPLIAFITTLLIGNVMRSRNNEAANILRRLIAPSLLIFLMLSGITAVLISAYRSYSLIISYLMNFLALTIIGGLVNRFSASYKFEKDYISSSLKYLSYFFILLGLGYLFGALYLPLFYPFAAASLVYLLLTPIPIINRTLKSGLYRILENSRVFAAAAFGVGLLYTVLLIPKPVLWNSYILIAFILIASVIIAYSGYRLYISGLSTIESIEEEIYESHRHDVRVVPSPEYSLFEDAVKEFVTYGKKDKLIAYLVHELTLDGFNYEEILSRLSRLIDYSSVTIQRRRVSRRVIELEVKERVELVNELINELMGGKSN
ncbi:MAG: hypothetical protein ACP5GY_08610 [Vulcanisaeta sp.]